MHTFFWSLGAVKFASNPVAYCKIRFASERANGVFWNLVLIGNEMFLGIPFPGTTWVSSSNQVLRELHGNSWRRRPRRRHSSRAYVMTPLWESWSLKRLAARENKPADKMNRSIRAIRTRRNRRGENFKHQVLCCKRRPNNVYIACLGTLGKLVRQRGETIPVTSHVTSSQASSRVLRDALITFGVDQSAGVGVWLRYLIGTRLS